MVEVDGFAIGDLNKDGEITEIDISAADFSSYNYGECLNGFSGRKNCNISFGMYVTQEEKETKTI